MKKIYWILIIAYIFRLFSLNQSLWLDEGTTAKVVLNYSFQDIILKFSPFDFHPPLYYLLMKAWTNIFGYSEIALRMPSVLFSLLTGCVVYLLGKKIKDEKTGLLAAVFFLFNPLIIYYSQEARMYSMAAFLLALSIYFLVKILANLRVNGLLNSLLFGLFISLSFATFYGSIFIIIPMLIYLFLKRKFSQMLVSAVILSIAFLLLSPLLIQQFSHSRESLIAVSNWKSVLGTASLKNLLMIPLKFVFGRISFYPKILYYSIAGLWSVFIWLFVIKGGFKNKLFSFLILSTLGIGIFFSFSSPLLQYFRFIYLIPIMSILLAFSLSGKAEYDLVGRILAGGFLCLSLIYLFFPQFHREDWKSLAGSLNAKLPVYMIKSSADALTYYRQDISLFELRNSVPTSQEIIVIPYTTDIYGYDYKNNLIRISYKNSKSISYRELQLEYWKK